MVIVQLTTNKKTHSLRFQDCLYIPKLPTHLLSISQLLHTGLSVMITQSTPHILFDHKQRLANPTLPKYLPLTCPKDDLFSKATFIPTSPLAPYLPFEPLLHLLQDLFHLQQHHLS